MVSSQERLREVIEGFRFNLGFSGGFYMYGNEEEDAGDKKLVGKYVNHKLLLTI